MICLHTNTSITKRWARRVGGIIGYRDYYMLPYIMNEGPNGRKHLQCVSNMPSLNCMLTTATCLKTSQPTDLKNGVRWIRDAAHTSWTPRKQISIWVEASFAPLHSKAPNYGTTTPIWDMFRQVNSTQIPVLCRLQFTHS